MGEARAGETNAAVADAVAAEKERMGNHVKQLMSDVFFEVRARSRAGGRVQARDRAQAKQ